MELWVRSQDKRILQKVDNIFLDANYENKGIIVEEYLFYPEPCEWILDNGYILNEALMYEGNEKFVVIKNLKEK